METITEKKNKKKKVWGFVLVITLLLMVTASIILQTPETKTIFNKPFNNEESSLSYSSSIKIVNITEDVYNTPNWTINLSGAEIYLDVSYVVYSNTTTEFTVNIPNKDKNNFKQWYQDNTNGSFNLSKIPIKDVEGNLLNISITEFDIENAAGSKSISFNITYLPEETYMVLNIGWNTVQIFSSTDEGDDRDLDAWSNKIFYDENNDRWHVTYIDSNADIAISSAPISNVSNWTAGMIIGAGTYDYEDYDCAIDFPNTTTTYLHCVYATASEANVLYRRIELTGSGTYAQSAGTEENPITSSIAGIASNDDSHVPKIILDSDRCVVMAFQFEDASSAVPDEYQTAITKEDAGTTCGDGDFDDTDHETGFPVIGIQSSAGYNDPQQVGLESYGNLDAQIYWIDRDDLTAAPLLTMYFNGTSNTYGPEVEINADVEVGGSYSGYDSVILSDGSQVTFALKDDELTVTSFKVNNTNDTTLGIETSTGILNIFGSSKDGELSATVNPTNDRIWLFSVPYNLADVINYTTSDDGGITWSTVVEWQNAPLGTDKIQHLSAHFSEEQCQAGLMWTSRVSTNYLITADFINDTCTGAEDTTPPTYSNLNVNTTINGTLANFSIVWNDETALHTSGGYIFTTNNSGAFTNDTFVSFSATPSPANVLKTLNATVGNVVAYGWYANDTSNNWNFTGLQYLTTTSEGTNCWVEETGKISIPPNCKFETIGGLSLP